MDIINPATEETIATLQENSLEEITAKYKSLRTGQKTWAKQSFNERLTCLTKFNQQLEIKLDDLALTLSQETGKPLTQAKNEINGARGRIEFFLENTEKYLQDEWIIQEGDTREKISYEALGVIANISAWNYPYLVGVNVFVPALIAGNAVLYKPSEFASLTGLKIAEMLHQAGVPKDAFQIVLGARKAGEALLALPLQGYFFTGSYPTGKAIYEKVATKMVPCQMELGGKDPLYVTEDNANIAAVAAAAVEGAFYNNGQSCCAVERVYVHEKVYDEFVEHFLSEAKKLKVGDPLEDTTFIGPLTREPQLNLLAKQVEDAVEKGATLLTGGKAREGDGYYFEPTVLTNVDHNMRVMKEESFGPIIGIQKVSNDSEALSLMQDTEFGLTAAVYTDSQARAEQILKQIETGTAYWNCCDRVSPNLPWSGRRHSGLGSTLSLAGIRAFTQPKAYHLRTTT